MMITTPEGVKCDYLKQAVSKAEEHAFGTLVKPGSQIGYDDRYGNLLTLSKCINGKSECGKCGRKVTVIIDFSKESIDGTLFDSKPKRSVKLYLTSAAHETIRVGGSPGFECSGVIQSEVAKKKKNERNVPLRAGDWMRQRGRK